ncbi:MAG: radical SAM/Cys-rich protein [Planctomycetota bacterium]|jgi:radical SAM/Cys-rich protein
MHDTLPLLGPSDFPAINRRQLETLQINIGLRCNQACLHCHVNSNPYRKEKMDEDTIALVIKFLQLDKIRTLDITGGAPELHPQFRELVSMAHSLGVHIIDRCNLTILEQPGFEDLAEFLAEEKVEVVASLPCYTEDNVDQQRGKGVFQSSIRGLQHFNRLGYGNDDSGLVLSLVYNPLGPTLPAGQQALEAIYKKELFNNYGIRFNRLFTLSNMPIKRFGSTLVSRGQFEEYMTLLKNAHRHENLDQVMCRSLVSVDWQGYLYDCDFNQMLGLSLQNKHHKPMHLSDLLDQELGDLPITVRNHCYGCTAGQGSSCAGALN